MKASSRSIIGTSTSGTWTKVWGQRCRAGHIEAALWCGTPHPNHLPPREREYCGRQARGPRFGTGGAGQGISTQHFGAGPLTPTISHQGRGSIVDVRHVDQGLGRAVPGRAYRRSTLVRDPSPQPSPTKGEGVLWTSGTWTKVWDGRCRAGHIDAALWCGTPHPNPLPPREREYCGRQARGPRFGTGGAGQGISTQHFGAGPLTPTLSHQGRGSIVDVRHVDQGLGRAVPGRAYRRSTLVRDPSPQPSPTKGEGVLWTSGTWTKVWDGRCRAGHIDAALWCGTPHP